MKFHFTLITCFFCTHLFGQSFELMPGTERLFIDAQYLKFFDQNKHWSLFSRSRATAEYDRQQTDVFTGAYLNYTTASGFGGTVLGRISNTTSGVDVGLHFFKANKAFMIYALPAINIGDELAYSWFSILRYTPRLSTQWKIYTSLELFSAFNEAGHAASVQRIRAGADRQGWQFGLAINLGQVGGDFENINTNPGLFIQRVF